MTEEDPMHAVAFEELYRLSERLKAEGVSTPDAWRLIFSVAGDLQAGDLGMGSVQHRTEVHAHCTALNDTLAHWDDHALQTH